ncbi:MAG: DUF402 domain-containing protein [Ktedonobacteraceae bacterium]|nr:DUF402 domain-containing protein [Ktedonobacteraceae bacterium]
MKCKRAHRTDWQRVTRHRFAMQKIASSDFTGYATLFCIDEVREPLYKDFSGQIVCLADNGYKWLQYFPNDSHHALTAVLDTQENLARLYIDICKRWYLDEQGELFYDDLYLDIDVSPAGEVTLLDVDELEEALRKGDVSSLDYELAWREADRLLTAIEQDMFPLLWNFDLCKDDLVRLAL